VAALIHRWLLNLRLGDPVIVVSGLPRSGTSMMMKMLDAGGLPLVTDGERPPDSDNPLGYFEDERVKRLARDADKGWVKQARGKAIKVISHLLESLPDDARYRVIFCRRDLDEVLASQNLMLERRFEGNPVGDEEAKDLYRKHLISVRLKLSSRTNFEILEVDYRDTLDDPLGCANRVRRFVGRKLDTKTMAGVVRPELYRNRNTWLGSGTAAMLLLLLLMAQPETAFAYIGPGAGFAFLGSFLAMFIAFAAALISLFTWPARYIVRRMRRRKVLGTARVRRVIILGLDGLDPGLTKRWIAEGYLPNLKQLAERGSFSRLRTTYPSISPVAWSSFMTGVDPSRHNIFDFLTRDVRTYRPSLSSSEIREGGRKLQVGDWLIPLSKPTVRNMRKSRAFWTILGEHGIRSDILRVPLTFPPEKFAGLLMSAMCIPDLRGTQGSFTYYTTDPGETATSSAAPEATGGERQLVRFEQGVMRARLAGPRNPLRTDHRVLSVPFSVTADFDKDECILQIGREKHRLREREYSPWIKLRFSSGPGVTACGIARFYVTKMRPHFGLYVTPINIDPGRPALPISWPGYYSVYLSRLIGDFATLGLAEDTWALNERVIDEEAFLKQTLDHHEEREAMFFNSLEKSREGVLACVFDGTDRLQHMFYRYLEDDHPANEGKDIVRYRHTIRDMYVRADEMVGRIMNSLRPDDLFMVISDHGFQSFRRGVNLNSWLLQHGFLHLKNGATESGDWFQAVDWSRTQAYALGLGGLYINQKGREAQGIVEAGPDKEAVKRRILEGLSGLRDDEKNQVAINEMFDADSIYAGGPYLQNAPDLLTGYNSGYRASWEGAVGRVTNEVFADNTKSWSGDHCVDPRLVPGVLFCDRRVTAEDPAIGDLAPTILDLFGVTVPPHMTGRVLDIEFAERASAVKAA
jgi:predicted AlkP superfamily phosphohydrolase/phosphomutase